MAFRKVVNLSNAADETDINQYADAFNGTPGAGQPLDLIDLAADRYYVVIKNGHANSKTLHLMDKDGVTQFLANNDGVQAQSGDPLVTAPVVNETAVQHLQNKQITMGHRFAHFRGTDRAATNGNPLPDVGVGDVFFVTSAADIEISDITRTVAGHEITLIFQAQGVLIDPSSAIILTKPFISDENAWLRLMALGSPLAWYETGRGGDFNISCRLNRSTEMSSGVSALTLSSNAITGGGTAIPWEAEEWDYGGFWAVGSPTNIVPPYTGKYRIFGAVTMQAGTDGTRGGYLTRGGTIADVLFNVDSGDASNVEKTYPFITELDLTAGQALNLFVGHHDGGSEKVQGITGGARLTYITVEYVGR